MADPAVRPVRSRAVLSHDVAGEVVLYDQQNQTAVGLNLTAAVIWDLCDGNHSVADMVAVLSETVGRERSTVAADVERGVRELLTIGLIIADAAEPVVEGASAA